MFVSPKNTDAQNAALLQSTKCTKMLCSSEMKSVALSVKSAYPDLQVEEIKPFKNWVAEHSKPFVFSKSYEEAKHDPIIVLHSSGSTGLSLLVAHGCALKLTTMKETRSPLH